MTEVTDADRRVADKWRRQWSGCQGEHTYLAQAFARHRAEAQAEAREVVRSLLGCLEIASVLPSAIGKVYIPRLDAPELEHARAFLERTAP